MTQFAIFYELSDLSSLAGTLQAAGLSNTLKNRARPFWNGGLKDWATAPVGAAPGDTSCPLCHRCVINSSGTLAEFRQLCYDVADFLIAAGNTSSDVIYLRALADDMAGVSGAIEPWV
jgi:hypothetical protein